MFIGSRKPALLLMASCLAIAVFAVSQARADRGKVQRRGMNAEVKIEQLISGNLSELNGRYKLRVADVTYEPGGFIGNHHHAGPGLRCVYEGTLTYIQEGITNHYGAGDCFYESGNVSHRAMNEGDVPVRLFNFQILPKDWVGSSAITAAPVK